MQQRLALPSTAIEIARFTIFLQLRDMPPNRAPTRNLTQIIFTAASAIIGNSILPPSDLPVKMRQKTPLKRLGQNIRSEQVHRNSPTFMFK